MENPTNCLQEAMFLASSSYSGSNYETMSCEENDDEVSYSEGLTHALTA